MIARNTKKGTALPWVAAGLGALLSGCGGGGGSSTSPTAYTGETLDSAFVARQGFTDVLDLKTGKFIGHTVPLDLTMPVETRRGNPLIEVQVASQEYYEIEESTGNVTALIDDSSLISGHRAYLSDGSFIDFGCSDQAIVTFAEASPNFTGSFIVDYHTSLDLSTGGGKITFRFPESFDNRAWLDQMPVYSGFAPSMDVEDLSLLSDLQTNSDGTAWPSAALAVGTKITSNLSVTRISRFGENWARTLSVGDNSATVSREFDGCGSIHSAYASAPLGFPASSQPYRVSVFNGFGYHSTPYECYLSTTLSSYVGDLSVIDEGQCDLWAAEKGW